MKTCTTTNRWLTISKTACFLLMPVLLAACSNGGVATYRTGGKVVFTDGKPLTGGVVEFRAVGGQNRVTARGPIQPDGSFRLSTFRNNDGAVEGEHSALVCPPQPVQEPGTPVLKNIPLIIDPRFTRFETSGLKFTVTNDPAKNEFTLQVEPPRQ